MGCIHIAVAGAIFASTLFGEYLPSSHAFHHGRASVEPVHEQSLCGGTRMKKKSTSAERTSNTYKKLREVVQMLVAYHEDIGIALRYAAVSREAGEDLSSEVTRTAMLLTRLSARQQDIASFLRISEPDDDFGIEETWAQYIPNEQIEAAIKAVESDVPPDEMVDAVRDFQSHILECLQTATEACKSERAKEYLKSVETRERAEIEALAIATQQAEDL
jgi:hypothetical protein